MIKRKYFKAGFFMVFFLLPFTAWAQKNIFIEAEAFEDPGGWVIDQQFIQQMGSAYLLAHGMGEKVADASTKFEADQAGRYFIWVRTKDWAPFPKGPGEFRLKINGSPAGPVLGSAGSSEWMWYKAGDTRLKKGENTLSLVDLTGFEGRVDAIFLTTEANFKPPSGKEELEKFRRELLDFPDEPEIHENFDLVVTGGGMAGICTAVQASRLGLKVALIQDRPVLGGNNSSEIRVHLKGKINKNHYPRLGRIVRELDNGDPGNAALDPKEYGNSRKLDVVLAEDNISLFLNMHVWKVKTENGSINSVIALDTKSGREHEFPGKLFADCTGDGTVGYLAGADYRMGRESREQTGESLAPLKEDNFTMGSSNLWNSTEREEESTFPETPWALPFTDEYHWDITHADWRWETGFGNFDPVEDAEEIRDHNFRAIYGNWSYLKNARKEKYARYKLNWVAFIAGKRESRRLMGDLVLQQQDLQEPVIYPDGMVTTTWDIDLHHPDSVNSKYYPGQEFISWYNHPSIKPYPIPYRCLYSRNIDNLFMAGRDISVTHVALGTVRVMRTTGMMGELVGYAAYLCRKYDASPREIYQKHLDELKTIVSENCTLP